MRPAQAVWFPHRHPPERAPPYVPAHDGEWPRSRAPARPQGRVRIPAKGPTDARAQPDSTPERCSPEHPPKSDTPEPVPEKMFPTTWNQTALSMPGQYATLGGVARDWTRSCVHYRGAKAETPALARSQ